MERLRYEFRHDEEDTHARFMAEKRNQADHTDQGSKYEPLSEAELATLEEMVGNGYGVALDLRSLGKTIATIRDLQGQVSALADENAKLKAAVRLANEYGLIPPKQED